MLLAEDGAGARFPVAHHATAVLALHTIDRIFAASGKSDTKRDEGKHELKADAASETDEERSHEHFNSEQESEEARSDADNKSDAANNFKAGNEVRDWGHEP